MRGVASSLILGAMPIDRENRKFVVIQADGDKGDELNNTVVRAFVGGE